jgi:hypothetical protein
MVIVDFSPFDTHKLGPGRQVPKSAIQGITADLDVRVNEAEHNRRRRRRVGAFTRRDVINRLTGIPINWVPAREVDQSTLEFLAGQAPDTIEVRHVKKQGMAVRRLLNPPLSIEHITVHSRDWDRGFAAINSVAGFSARSLVLSIEPSDRELAELESNLYGIGLSIDRGGELQLLTHPAPFLPEFFTALAWQVAEGVYATALERRVL